MNTMSPGPTVPYLGTHSKLGLTFQYDDDFVVRRLSVQGAPSFAACGNVCGEVLDLENEHAFHRIGSGARINIQRLQELAKIDEVVHVTILLQRKAQILGVLMRPGET